MIGEHMAHAIARAFAPQRDRNTLAGSLQRQNVGCYRLEHIRTRFGTLG